MKEIFNQVLHGKPHIHIGKLGITDSIVDEIKKQYKKRKIIKVKFLNKGTFSDYREATEFLAKITDSKVLDIRGKTCILLHKREFKKNSE